MINTKPEVDNIYAAQGMLLVGHRLHRLLMTKGRCAGAKYGLVRKC